ncbi:MAG: hypothetical protein HY680_05335 [Chloroflexi bacterium]|nr:hypothetical protein [Chloroflexota bacterium]
MNTLARSYRLALESFKVLRRDPELAVFPVISFLGTLLAAGAIGSLGWLSGILSFADAITPGNVLLLFLFYFCTYFVTIYFQVGLVACVQHRLAGGDPDLSYGVKAASRRLGPIVSWAVVAAIVGLVLGLLQRAARKSTGGVGGIGAQVAIGIVGMAWSLATFFVIPILAAEGIGGLAVVKRSAGIIRHRWGEAVVGQAGIGLFMGLVAVGLALVLGLPGVLALASGSTVGVVAGVAILVVAVLAVLTIIAVAATLQAIYTVVVYQYAIAGQRGEGFPAALVEGAFQPGQGQGGNQYPRGIV